MTKKLQAALEEIASADDMPETLKTSDLLNKKFKLEMLRLVNTVNGDRYIGGIVIDGITCEAWMSGSKLHKQLALIESELPLDVTITKEEGQYAPYLLYLA
tara:strand:+ start:543 stop:845 length:303 start_codon:yes stop_codon:yes gene_type:complete